MLTQQVARYLLKTARSVLKGNEPSNDTMSILASFLSRQDQGAAFDVLGNDADLVGAFAGVAAHELVEPLVITEAYATMIAERLHEASLA